MKPWSGSGSESGRASAREMDRDGARDRLLKRAHLSVMHKALNTHL